MTELNGLPGISEETREAKIISAGSELEDILSEGLAATTAGDNGAINIWKDDDGFIRCEAMKYMVPIEKKKYKTLEHAENWVDKWLEIIN